MMNLEKWYRKLWIILCLIPSTAFAEFRHFNDWSTKEKALFASYGAAAYIDHRQTRVALRNGYEELNPVYGNNPHRDKSIALNLLFAGGLYYVVGKYDTDELNRTLSVLVATRTAVVIHNDSIGVSWKVAF